jgi:hypothetical protein
MFSDNASAYVDFHNRANHSFCSVEKDFLGASEKLNRQEEEYRFQQLKKDYVNELKHQLEMSAQEILNKNRLTREAGLEFNDFINEYLYRFVQKINAY